MRNLKELNGKIKHIGDFCGYEVYIPSYYNNPISYLNRNYILNNLPNKSHIYCSNIQHSDCHPLSCVAIDGGGEICAEIIVKERNNMLIIDSVKYKDKETLLKLRKHLMSENDIQTYPAVILCFNSETISLYTIELLGAIYDESHGAYILQLI